jgi:hypothetical protein
MKAVTSHSTPKSRRSSKTRMLKLLTHSTPWILSCLLFSICGSYQAWAQSKQPSDAVQAYRLCATFQHLLGEDLDFGRAYEATFARNTARRRAIAIKDGEFDDADLTNVDDVTIINAYKSRMQLFYLMLPLAGPDSNEEAALFFPPQIKQIFNRKGPDDPKEFAAFASQLNRDVLQFREHMDRLAARYPTVAERIRRFKTEMLSVQSTPPKNFKVEPQQNPYDGPVVHKDEKYYEMEGYTVIREGSEMRIVGIRFFTRLF